MKLQEIAKLWSPSPSWGGLGRGVMVLVLFLFLVPAVFAQESVADNPARPSSEIVRLSWKASNEGKLDELNVLVAEITKDYEAQAQSQATTLSAFPARDQIENYKIMNDVATALFIKAEASMHQGKNEEAKALFDQVIRQYPWAQNFDPSRGSYWSIKEKSEASLRVMSGELPGETKTERKGPHTVPHFAFPGTQKVIDYRKYGKFLNVGTKDYHYRILRPAALASAMGEAIYPNIGDIFKDPAYKRALQEGRLEGSHWDFVNSPDMEAAIFKWATAQEPWGTRLFYMGIIFEKAKMYYEAIKAYQAVIVHFPNTLSWTYWQTPWYPGQAAIAKIKHIIYSHPELNLEFKDANIRIINAYDNDPGNDMTITRPGVLNALSVLGQAKLKMNWETKVPMGRPVKVLGQGQVRLIKYQNGHWQMVVGDKPFLIQGVTYLPTKIGQGPDKGNLTNWTEDDTNHNNLTDGPYEAWVDKNHNNKQDLDEPSVGDLALMKTMGVNTIRIYHHPLEPNKNFLSKMYKDYGFMVAMGDFVGKYTNGSGAEWSEGTDYENPVHLKNMTESVRKMVLDYKDEPYILMWILGNENNYGVASNADKKPKAYFEFINNLALMIKSLDPNHPVAVCNGDTLFLDIFAKTAPDVDIFGANVYRGDYGFGSFWQQVAEVADRPAFISEYGAPAWAPPMSYEEAQEAQAEYHRGNWLDIKYNSAGYPDGTGNALGGIAFEWLDEWWKNYEPSLHDKKADVVGPFAGGYYYEEWFGLFGQGDGHSSPFLRESRKVYDVYKELWAF